MKKVQKAFMLYFSLILFSVIIQSCCTQKHKIIGNGMVAIFSIDDESYIQSDTIDGPFILIVEYETAITSLDNFSFISSTLATSCDDEYLNVVEEDKIQISCDQSFTYDGNDIAANSDFAFIEDLSIAFQQFHNNSLEITFPQSFLDKAEFEKKEYTFKITAATDDGLDLENQIPLFINL